MANFLRELKYAIRLLAKSPGFSVVAVLTLALGIGANTAIYSVVNGLLLHPSGILHPKRVVALRARYEKLNLNSIVISAPDFDSARRNKEVFVAAAMEVEGDFSYTAGNWPRRLRCAKVSQEWFEVFEARPMLGRVFAPEEDQPKADHEVVLAYGTWISLFGSDAQIIGKTASFNQEPYKVIGVMGPEFQWPNPTDLWAPLALASQEFSVDNYFNENYFAVARLKPGVTFEKAAAFMNLLSQQLSDDPRLQGYPKRSGWGLFTVPFTKLVYGDLQTPLIILLAAVGLVLLIACANVGGLLLARATSRAKEFAVRAAMGGSPWRLTRQTLTESLVLSAAGMALGLSFATIAIRALLALAPEQLSSGISIELDGHVLLFTASAALLSALIFGAAPALQIARMDPQANLKQGRGTGEASQPAHRFRDVLVVGELALALVLLAGAGVFLKSLSNLQEVNVGFRPQGLMTAALSLPKRSYDTPAKQIAFVRGTLERLNAAPRVDSAAAAAPIPFSGYGGSSSFDIEGRASVPGDPGPHGDVRGVSPKYMETMGIRLLQGRTFSDQDREGAEPVAMVDENLARQYWPNSNALGQHIRFGSNSPWKTIVGIVMPVRHSQVAGEESTSEGSEGSGKGVFYFPLYQSEAGSTFLIARTKGDPAVLGATIREAVHAQDPGQPIWDPKTMDARIALSLGPRRSAVTLLGVFAGMALLLAAIGLFGLIRYTVAQRTQEIGVRLALGATGGDVMRMILNKGLKLALLGVACGLLSALAMTRALTSLLYEVSATDPLTFTIVAVVLVCVALLASYLPARRATRVDPLTALRYE